METYFYLCSGKGKKESRVFLKYRWGSDDSKLKGKNSQRQRGRTADPIHLGDVSLLKYYFLVI